MTFKVYGSQQTIGEGQVWPGWAFWQLRGIGPLFTNEVMCLWWPSCQWRPGHNVCVCVQVSREADSTLRAASALCGEVARGRAHSRRLRAAAAAALAAAEAASRDYTAPGNTHPLTTPLISQYTYSIDQQGTGVSRFYVRGWGGVQDNKLTTFLQP